MLRSAHVTVLVARTVLFLYIWHITWLAVQRIRSETGCNISISEEPVASAPPAAGKKGGEQKASQQPAPAAAAQQLCQVLVDGPRDGVQRAVEQLQVLVKRLENEATRDLTIEARLHRLIIGANGAGIRVLSQKFPNVCTRYSICCLLHCSSNVHTTYTGTSRQIIPGAGCTSITNLQLVILPVLLCSALLTC